MHVPLTPGLVEKPPSITMTRWSHGCHGQRRPSGFFARSSLSVSFFGLREEDTDKQILKEPENLFVRGTLQGDSLYQQALKSVNPRLRTTD
jgi:hypothetical protein